MKANMDKLIELITENWPQIVQGLISLGLLVGGIDIKLAQKKQKRVLSNLKRPIMVIGTEDTDMVDQVKLLEEVGLFSVTNHRGDKATDFLKAEHRLIVLGFADNDRFSRAFECARSRAMPVLVYAKPGSVSSEGMAKISGYSFASICNTDLRLISDVFAVMSTFPEK
jgi:hypothetical protein